MGQALYRKYRSKSLDEIVGQEHITKTLKQAVESGRISHAYLFTGPHGVGKTSIARILAHEVNGLPYTDDASHIDIIEIDAASNRRIDEIRELREKVYVAPVSAKYKVYIIDEVHMLTREAFNALLKTLEEPPAHVIFILATTDAHKLPDTIVSRTQRYSFKPAEPAKVRALLGLIAKKEDIEISDEALELLAIHGNGSFRDSVSLLDQVSGRGKAISAADVLEVIGIPPLDTLMKLLSDLVETKGPAQLFQDLSDLYLQGYQAAMIAKVLGQMLREQLMRGTNGLPVETVLALLRELLEVPGSADPERMLEIVLLQSVGSISPTSQPQPKQESDKKINAEASDAAVSSSKPAQKIASESPQILAPPPESPAKKAALTDINSPVKEKPGASTNQPTQAAAKVEAKNAAVKEGPISSEMWPTILQALKQKHNTIYGVVRMAQPEFGADGTLRLLFGFAFHQKRINEAKNRQLLAEVIEQATGHQVTIECVVDKSAAGYKAPPVITPTPPAAASPDDLVTINNIFGGGELLES